MYSVSLSLFHLVIDLSTHYITIIIALSLSPLPPSLPLQLFSSLILKGTKLVKIYYFQSQALCKTSCWFCSNHVKYRSIVKNIGRQHLSLCFFRILQYWGIGGQCYIIGVLFGDCQRGTLYHSYMVFSGNLKSVRVDMQKGPFLLYFQINFILRTAITVQAIRTRDIQLNAPVIIVRQNLNLMPTRSSNSKFSMR